MTMRFIFACIAIVAICLAAIPMIPAFNGISDERAALLANVENYSLSVPPQLAEDPQGTDFATAESVSSIEPAAGDETTDDDNQSFGAGFGGQAPAALTD